MCSIHFTTKSVGIKGGSRHSLLGISRIAWLSVTFCLAFFFGSLENSMAETNKSTETRDRKVEALEHAVEKLTREIEILKREREAEKLIIEKQEEDISGRKYQIGKTNQENLLNESSWINRFNLGGYGEIHANFNVGDDKDLFDIHRLVLYLGYDFNEWIKFHSELEIEHAFVSDDSDGEIGLEQAYVDFLLSESFNVRFGRILTPLGIINQRHEPPSFNGVERPSFDKYIIPSTWSSDGLGVFGAFAPGVKYEAYVVGGLDGSQFDSKNGIRGGRIKDRPSLSDPALTARLDFHPFVYHSAKYDQRLRLGVSGYFGGLDNGPNGSNPDIDGDIQIYSGDFDYSVMDLDLRGVVAFEKIDGAEEKGNGTASEIFGWYLEAGYHFFPDTLKKGLLEKADATLFVRYDDYDTQYNMPESVPKNPAGDRNEWTFGLSFHPIPNFVIKTDYQIRKDGTTEDLDDLFNLGIGWQF